MLTQLDMNLTSMPKCQPAYRHEHNGRICNTELNIYYSFYSNDELLRVVMLSVIMLSIVMPSPVMLRVVLLNVFLLSVVMLSVVASGIKPTR